MNIDELLQCFPGKKLKTGNGFNVQCPGHDDKNPSLSISNGEKGIVLFCHTRKCDTDAILAKIGLTKKDLFYKSNGTEPKKKIVKISDYNDEDGNLLFQVVKFQPKGFLPRRPDGKGGFVWNMEDTEKIIYNLPNVLKAVKNGEPVYITEGEGDADVLIESGLCGTTAPFGAMKWKKTYNKYFKDAVVFVVSDTDEAGLKHGIQVSNNLHGIARSVKNVILPIKPPEGKDATDFLRKYTLNDLRTLCDGFPEYTPTTPNDTRTGTRPKAEEKEKNCRAFLP